MDMEGSEKDAVPFADGVFLCSAFVQGCRRRFFYGRMFLRIERGVGNALCLEWGGIHCNYGNGALTAETNVKK
jgi:hypothetical protein